MALATSLTPSARRLSLILGEGLALLGTSFLITGYEELLQQWTQPDSGGIAALDWVELLSRALLVTAVCQIAFSFQGLFDWRITSNRNECSIRLLQGIFYSGILLGLLQYLLRIVAEHWDAPAFASFAPAPWPTLVALVAIYLVSLYYRMVFHWFFRRWRLTDRILLVGHGEMATALERELSLRQDPGYEVAGFVGTRPEEQPPDRIPWLGPLEQVCDVALQHRVKRVVVALQERRGRLPTLDLLDCRLSGMRVEEAAALYERLTGKIAVQRLRPSYLIFSEGFQLSRTAHMIKRSLDVILASVGLLLSLPLSLLVCAVVKLDSAGPVFFKQIRVGKDGKVFTIYKFRTMRQDAESQGPQWASHGDQRVTRAGRFLRRSRIDEIPQMWNVLRGEMSFVGPRPERPYFVEQLRKEIPYYMERLLVKPGITGWAQINYRYGASVEDALTKLQYDLYYIKNMSIWLDLLIVVRTIKVIVLRLGAV